MQEAEECTDWSGHLYTANNRAKLQRGEETEGRVAAEDGGGGGGGSSKVAETAFHNIHAAAKQANKQSTWAQGKQKRQRERGGGCGGRGRGVGINGG